MIRERNPGDVFDARDFYDYDADNADQDLMDYIKREAGWRSVDGDPNQYELEEAAEPLQCIDGYSPELPQLCLVEGGDGADDLVGSDFDDHVIGNEGADALSGLDGNDTIRVG